MPIYIFANPANEEEIIEVVMSVHDEHIYIKDGIKWNRVWTKPTASTDTKLDPFSPKDFVRATGKGKDTYGSLLDRSKEMSIQRQDKLGYDPLKEKMYDNYSKKRGGKIDHPEKRKEKLDKIKSEGISLKFKK